MPEKKIGYILLGSGLFLMVFAFIIVILSFLGVIKPFSFIETQAPSFNTSNLIPTMPGLPAPKGEKIEVIPTDTLNTVINLTTLFFLMTFVMSFGFKLSDLGVKLLRPIKIEAKQATTSSVSGS